MVYLMELTPEQLSVLRVAVNESIETVKKFRLATDDQAQYKALTKELNLLESIEQMRPEVVGGRYNE